jgi:MerR family transcriptional regulator, light-induced transcriptional regulator
MGQYSIKELEALSGVKAHTIRIWEQRYDFLKPKRTDTNIRLYSDDQLRLLLNIGTLNRSGMKISKIAELNQDELNEKVMEVYAAANDCDNVLDSLMHATLDFDEQRFEKAFATAMLKLDFEKAFTDVVLPFMSRTGLLWATGAVNVAQEHFISHLVRRKIYSAINNLSYKPSQKAKRAILFLPEGEQHDLLLLFTEYLLRKHRHRVLYLGSSVPVIDLGYSIKAYKPDLLISFFTIPLRSIPLTTYLKNVASIYPKCRLIVGGSQLSKEDVVLPPKCRIAQNAEDILQAID